MGRSKQARKRRRSCKEISGSETPIKKAKDSQKTTPPTSNEEKPKKNTSPLRAEDFLLKESDTSSTASEGSWDRDNDSNKSTLNIDMNEMTPEIQELFERKFDEVTRSFNAAIESLNDSFKAKVIDMDAHIEKLEETGTLYSSKLASEQPIDSCANTIVIEGLPYDENEVIEDKVYTLIGELSGGSNNAPEIIQVARYKTYNPKKNGIIKAAFKDLDTKRAILNKKYNLVSELYKSVRIRSSKTHIERVNEKNMWLLLRELALTSKFKLNGYGLIVPIDYAGKGTGGKPMPETGYENADVNRNPSSGAARGRNTATAVRGNRGRGGQSGRGTGREFGPQRKLPQTPQSKTLPPLPLPQRANQNTNTNRTTPNHTSTPLQPQPKKNQAMNGARQKEPAKTAQNKQVLKSSTQKQSIEKNAKPNSVPNKNHNTTLPTVHENVAQQVNLNTTYPIHASGQAQAHKSQSHMGTPDGPPTVHENTTQHVNLNSNPTHAPDQAQASKPWANTEISDGPPTGTPASTSLPPYPAGTPIPPLHFAMFKNSFSYPPPQTILPTPEAHRGNYDYGTPYPPIPDQQNWYCQGQFSPYQVDPNNNDEQQYLEHDMSSTKPYQMDYMERHEQEWENELYLEHAMSSPEHNDFYY